MNYQQIWWWTSSLTESILVLWLVLKNVMSTVDFSTKLFLFVTIFRYYVLKFRDNRETLCILIDHQTNVTTRKLYFNIQKRVFTSFSQRNSAENPRCNPPVWRFRRNGTSSRWKHCIGFCPKWKIWKSRRSKRLCLDFGENLYFAISLRKPRR